MKARAYPILAILFVAGLAQAGFRHPVEDTGAEAQAIQSTPLHPVIGATSPTYSTSGRAGQSAASSQSAANSQSAPTTASSPAAASAPVRPNAKETHAAVAASPLEHARVPANSLPARIEVKTPAAPHLGSNSPAKAPARPVMSALHGPVPKAPALPSADKIGVPALNLSPFASRDGLLSMPAPDPLSLQRPNRAQVHAFLKHARGLPLPIREFSTEVRSLPITEHYRAALHPEPGKSFRTPYKLSLAKVGKIPSPDPITQYENMVKRIDSLFLAIDVRYARAVMNLAQLAHSPTNARELQARDALFAGLVATRAGWATTAAMLYEEAGAKRIERNDRYLKLLWSELEKVPNPVLLDQIVGAVSPLRVRDSSPVGDQANFALAKRLLLQRTRAPSQVFPSSDVFQQRIASAELRDKLSLIRYVGELRDSDPSRRESAVSGLRAIEAASSETNRQQARLALARSLLQHGAPAEALALYRNVRKDGKNRLSVLGEQTYAEYVNGEYQDSLGKTVALQTPYFRFGFAPDVNLVEILTRKAMCDFGGAEAGVKRFGETYGRELNALEDVLNRKAAPAAFYEELMAYADRAEPYRYQRYLLQLASVMENQKTMNDALGELRKLDLVGVKQKSLERPEGWDEFAADLRGRWENKAGELRYGSAETALVEAKYLAQRLRHTFSQVELIDLDVSTSAAKNYDLQSALNFPTKRQEPEELGPGQVRWGFENEVWEDEIDYMKAKNPSKCAQLKAAAL